MAESKERAVRHFLTRGTLSQLVIYGERVFVHLDQVTWEDIGTVEIDTQL